MSVINIKESDDTRSRIRIRGENTFPSCLLSMKVVSRLAKTPIMSIANALLSITVYHRGSLAISETLLPAVALTMAYLPDVPNLVKFLVQDNRLNGNAFLQTSFLQNNY